MSTFPPVIRRPLLGTLRRRARQTSRAVRGARMFVHGLQSARHPLVANIVPIRRCNLSCTYCNQFDTTSKPVETAVMLQRLDRLAALGTAVVTLTGGEPLLHPELHELIARVRRNGAICTANTNGYLLTLDHIRRFNDAGLDYLLISIDNLEPDGTSRKSLRLLDHKLQLLAGHADFDVIVNAVLGADVRHPEDALTVAARARDLGFTMTLGIAHAAGGHVVPMDDLRRDVYERFQRRVGGSMLRFAHYAVFQRNLIEGEPNHWHCPAGGRFLYICEDGLVHFCSQQRGRPGIPLERYGDAELKHWGGLPKDCSAFCSIPCVHETALLERFRKEPAAALDAILNAQKQSDPRFATPFSVCALRTLFLTGPWKRPAAAAAVRLLRLGPRRAPSR